MDGPNPIVAGFSMLAARRLSSPDPTGSGDAPAGGLGEVLTALADGGIAAIPSRTLAEYLSTMATIDPDRLSRDGALSFWINLYNAGALDLALRTHRAGESSVLGIPGTFRTRFIEVAGEHLSLDGIEHGKVRRFGDPRVHAALVCGSISCPTLRHEAYRSDELHDQLEDQMVSFLSSGAAVADPDAGRLSLSRIFLWYGADFVHPASMPSLRVVTKRSVAVAIRPWLPDATGDWLTEARPEVVFQEYDWALGCAVRRPEGI